MQACGSTVTESRPPLPFSCDSGRSKKGAVFASDYEYPGRYSRWDIGFIDPPLELVSRGRDFTLRALNQRGRIILAMLTPAVTENQHVEHFQINDDNVTGRVLPMPSDFPEELRSKQPSIFSLLRALTQRLSCHDEYLSFYGAFGYDLT